MFVVVNVDQMCWPVSLGWLLVPIELSISAETKRRAERKMLHFRDVERSLSTFDLV